MYKYSSFTQSVWRNIGSPALSSRDRGHIVNKIYHRQTIQHHLCIIDTKDYCFQPIDNPPELQGEETSAKLEFLVYNRPIN